MKIFLQSFHQLVILLVSSFSQFDVIFDRNFCLTSIFFYLLDFIFLKITSFASTRFFVHWHFTFYLLPHYKLKPPFMCVIKTITKDFILPNFQPIFILGSTWFVAHLLTKCCCCLLSNRKYSARTSDVPRINKTRF